MFPHMIKSSPIGVRRRHSKISDTHRSSIDVANNRAIYVSKMIAKLNMESDYISAEPINKNKLQVAQKFSNNANQLRHGSDQIVAVNRNPLLR